MSDPFFYRLNRASKTKIIEHLQACDTSFSPPLSTRVQIKDYARKIECNAMRFEAWKDDKLVGLVAAYFNDHLRRIAYITSVSIVEEFVGKGVANILLKRCVDYAKSSGVNKISLSVSKKNISAIELYKKNSFILDIEDGEVRMSGRSFSFGNSRMSTHVFDVLCDRALLACSALKQATTISSTLCYYGAIFNFHKKVKSDTKPLTVLMGGTLCNETGAKLLIDTIRMMVSCELPWLKNIRFEITGKGDSIDEFNELAKALVHPEIVVHGRLTDSDYAEVLNRADIGLSLKLNNGPYANTTFPSKVIEYAAAGLLIVTTDISDVRAIFGEGALYLKDDDPLGLIRHLEFISTKPNEAFIISELGQQAVQKVCSPNLVGRELHHFIFGAV
jgi:glycosyltransferase involved in cell wall biosynthesis